MKKVTFPFNDTKTLSLSGGGTVSWPLARIQQKLKNGRAAMLRRFIIEFSGTISTAATTGKALYDTEFWKLIKQLRISRVGGMPRIKITGHSVRCWNALTNFGIDRGMKSSGSGSTLGLLAAANATGSAVPTTFTVRVAFCFDTPGLRHRDYFVKAASLYEKGSIDIDYGDPATVWDSTITLTTSLTANLYAELGAGRHVSDGVDLELFNLDNTTTSSGSTLPISRGTYPVIAMACEKFATGAGGGGDDHTLFSSINATNFFPEELPSLNGKQLRDRYLLDQTEGQAESAVALGACVPLVYPEAFGDIQSCALRAEQDWSLSDTLTGSLANGHRLLLARVLPRDPNELTDLACTHGVNIRQGTLQAVVPDPTDPTTMDGSNFVPVRLRPDVAPSNIVSAGPKMARRGCPPKAGGCAC